VPKTIPVNLQAAYDSRAAVIAYALKIVRKDAAVYGWTSADVDATLDGVDYVAAPGLDVQSWVSSAGLAVDATELTVTTDETIITRADVLAGRWNGAAFTLYRYNVQAPADGAEALGAGILGELQPRRGVYVAELRGLQQYLQQPVGAPSTKTCRARLGDAKCGVNLAGYTVTGTVDGVTSSQVFADSTRAEAADYYTAGLITWTSGLNLGLTAQVKTFGAGGDFTLSVPMLQAVQVGDTYSLIAGCTKRFDEDCVAKFSNALNFQGEPHRPTVDDLTSAPEPSA